MPRYLIERSFSSAVAIPVDQVVERNADAGVTWLCSYVSDDRRTAFDLYEAPTPEAIRATSARNRLPIERITEVRVLDPYSYVEEQGSGGNMPGVGIVRVETGGRTGG